MHSRLIGGDSESAENDNLKDSRDQVVNNLEGTQLLEAPRNHDACAPVDLGRMPQVSLTADRDARPTYRGREPAMA